jgi:hypothetical protein
VVAILDGGRRVVWLNGDVGFVVVWYSIVVGTTVGVNRGNWVSLCWVKVMMDGDGVEC